MEAIYSPEGDLSKLNVILLYNLVNSDVTDSYAFAADQEIQSLSLTGYYQIYRYVRAIVEYARDMENSTNQLLFGINTAF